MCPRWSPLRRWSSRTSSTSSTSAFDGIGKDVVSVATSIETSVEKNTNSPYYFDDVPQIGRFSLPLTIKFITATILVSTAAAFSVGCVARIILLSKFGVLSLSHDATLAPPVIRGPARHELPSPTIIPGKDVPYTTYASKTFRVEGAATSHTLHIDRRGAAAKVASHAAPAISTDDLRYIELAGAQKSLPHDNEKSFLEEEDDDDGDAANSDYSHNSDSDGLHLPAGQHLLVDIKDVDSEFLNSEELLATAMVELIKESKLTLLSYHCHSLVPIGVSCAGVLLESHVSSFLGL